MKEVRRQLRLGRLEVRYSRRGRDNMGRFGGGWNWKLGAQWSNRCILFSVLVAEIRVEWIGSTRKVIANGSDAATQKRG